MVPDSPQDPAEAALLDLRKYAEARGLHPDSPAFLDGLRALTGRTLLVELSSEELQGLRGYIEQVPTFFKGAVAAAGGNPEDYTRMREDFEPQPHQEAAREKTRSSHGRQLIFHSLGSGKTPTGILSSDAVTPPGEKTLAIVPAALQENFLQQGVQKFVRPEAHQDFSAISLEKFRRDPEGVLRDINPTTLNIDELHKAKDLQSQTYDALMRASRMVPNVIGQTGTPVMNDPSEIIPLLNIISGQQPLGSREAFEKRYIRMDQVNPGFLARMLGVKPGVVKHLQNTGELGKVLNQYIHRYSGDPEYLKQVPDVDDQTVEVEMSPYQKKMHDFAMHKGLNWLERWKVHRNIPPSKSEAEHIFSMLNQARQASVGPHVLDSTVPAEEAHTKSPKLQRVLADLKEHLLADPLHKAVIYSNQLEAGINPLVQALRAENIPYGVFTGMEADRDRQRAKNEFNAGNLRALLMSPAGGTGLDLKGTTLFQLLDPHWNPEVTNQALGRARRFRSHTHLPEDKRKVNVRRYLATYPKGWFGGRDTSVEEYVAARAKEKSLLNQELLDLIGDQQPTAPAAQQQKAAALEKVAMVIAWKDRLPGGLADDKTPADFKARSLRQGAAVESEHTSDKRLATEVAMDHLTEDPSYYSKLKAMEGSTHKALVKDAVIRYESGKWVLHTRSGGRVLGTHPSKARALAQERAIQAHKHGAKTAAPVEESYPPADILGEKYHPEMKRIFKGPGFDPIQCGEVVNTLNPADGDPVDALTFTIGKPGKITKVLAIARKANGNDKYLVEIDNEPAPKNWLAQWKANATYAAKLDAGKLKEKADSYQATNYATGEVQIVTGDEIGKVVQQAKRANAWLNALETLCEKQAKRPKYLYHIAPPTAGESIENKGLLGAEQLSKDPEALEAARPGNVHEWMERYVSEKGLPHREGTSFLFKLPTKGVSLPDTHPLKAPGVHVYRVNLDKLKQRYPDARLHGMELVPHGSSVGRFSDDDWDALSAIERQKFMTEREHTLAPSEVNKLVRRSAASHWKDYSGTPDKYAPDVPHVNVITGRGAIDPDLLEPVPMRKAAAPSANAPAKKLTLGLDFDDTYTKDPSFWNEVIRSAQRRGYRVVIVTARPASDHEEVRRMTAAAGALPLVMTALKAKRPVTDMFGQTIDIWIDDRPQGVMTDHPGRKPEHGEPALFRGAAAPVHDKISSPRWVEVLREKLQRGEKLTPQWQQFLETQNPRFLRELGMGWEGVADLMAGGRSEPFVRKTWHQGPYQETALAKNLLLPGMREWGLVAPGTDPVRLSPSGTSYQQDMPYLPNEGRSGLQVDDVLRRIEQSTLPINDVVAKDVKRPGEHVLRADNVRADASGRLYVVDPQSALVTEEAARRSKARKLTEPANAAEIAALTGQSQAFNNATRAAAHRQSVSGTAPTMASRWDAADFPYPKQPWHSKVRTWGARNPLKASGLAGLGLGAGLYALDKLTKDTPPQVKAASAIEFAPGIPAERRVHPIPGTKDATWDYTLHRHNADRAGLHFDLRLSDGTNAHSWAIPKADMPGIGEKRLAVQQQTHTPKYMGFSGVIASGYGKGDVSIEDRGKAHIEHADDDEVRFALIHKRNPETFMLRRMGNSRNWVIVNTTPAKANRPDVPMHKPPYKESKPDAVQKYMGDEWALTAKIDGAHTLLHVGPRRNEVFSYMESKTGPGRINHSFIDDTGHNDPSLRGTVVRMETVAVDSKGTPVPAHELAGILNSTPENGREKLRVGGLRLRHALLAPHRVQVGEKWVEGEKLPFAQQRKILERIASQLGDRFFVPQIARTQGEKADLLQQIEKRKHPQTSEGVVAHNLEDGSKAPVKIKFRQDNDVFIQNVFEEMDAEGKPKGRAGGYEYSLTPDGPIVGRVGTGLSHEEKYDLWKNRDQYKGVKAVILARDQFSGGAWRQPAHSHLHL